jgi:hypothetical protein
MNYIPRFLDVEIPPTVRAEEPTLFKRVYNRAKHVWDDIPL